MLGVVPRLLKGHSLAARKLHSKEMFDILLLALLLISAVMYCVL